MKVLLEKKEAEIKELRHIKDLAWQLVIAFSNPFRILQEDTPNPLVIVPELQQAIEQYEEKQK